MHVYIRWLAVYPTFGLKDFLINREPLISFQYFEDISKANAESL